jgi:hypothetical protein
MSATPLWVRNLFENNIIASMELASFLFHLGTTKLDARRIGRLLGTSTMTRLTLSISFAYIIIKK